MAFAFLEGSVLVAHRFAGLEPGFLDAWSGWHTFATLAGAATLVAPPGFAFAAMRH